MPRWLYIDIQRDNMTQKQVLPGDEIAVEEEYVAAEGTYVRDGKI